MNIDNASLLSVAAPVEGLDTLQPSLPSDSAISGGITEFSETLTQKISQLQGLTNLSTESFEGGNLLPQLADLMNGVENKQQQLAAGLVANDEMAVSLSSLVETGLAQESMLETEIDVDNTLETLANVLDSLEKEKDELGEDILALSAQVAVEIENLENRVPKAVSIPLNQQQEVEVSIDGVEEFISELEIENPTSISTPLVSTGEIQTLERSAVMNPVSQQITGFNKESLSLKQMVDEHSVSMGALGKPEAENPLQKNTLLTETGQKIIDPAMATKPNEKGNILATKVKDFDLSSDKTAPKFAMDIANLNRAVVSGNKTEIPPMTKHFAHPEWNKEMGERVIFMHKQAIPSAELRLNPAHLGPVTIKVETAQDQVSVAFTAQHAAVKEAIDAALPKLREMLTAQQLNLSEVSVSQEDTRQKQQQAFSQMGSDAGKGEKQTDEMAENGQAEKTMDIAGEIEAGRAIASNGVLSIFA